MNAAPLLLLLGATLPALAARAAPDAGHAAAEREASFIVPLAPAAAFPLFKPLGEKAWAEGWQPVFASAADARLHDGTVFTVAFAHPGGEPVESVWTISRYDPPRLVEYRNVIGRLRATRIEVACAPAADGTRVTVRYTYRGLSAAGDEQIAGITPERFRAMIEQWRASIGDYLRRGTPASP